MKITSFKLYQTIAIASVISFPVPVFAYSIVFEEVGGGIRTSFNIDTPHR